LFPATRSAPSEAKRSKIGRQRRRPELEPSPTDFARPKPSSRDSTDGLYQRIGPSGVQLRRQRPRTDANSCFLRNVRGRRILHQIRDKPRRLTRWPSVRIPPAPPGSPREAPSLGTPLWSAVRATSGSALG
jgi:hypothetical protein